MSKILKVKFPVTCTFTPGSVDFVMTTTYMTEITFCWPHGNQYQSSAYFDMYPPVPTQQRVYFCFLQIEADNDAKQWATQETGYVHNSFAPHSSVANLALKPTPQIINNGPVWVSTSDAPDTHKGYAWTDPDSGVTYYLTEWYVNYTNTTSSVVGSGSIHYNVIITYLFDDDDTNYDAWLADSRLTGFVETLENYWTTVNGEDELPTRAHFPEMIDPEEPEPPTGLNLYAGDSQVVKVYAGENDITKLYIGDSEI